MYAWKNGVAEPRMVGLCRAIRSGVVTGSNASNSTRVPPARNTEISIAMPPMWEIGQAIG